ncbi:MAG: 2-phospho-L-lactate guanylyltransferase [Haloquadratum sp.]
MHLLVPYTNRDPKSRLSPVLSAAERRAFSLAMLCDVVAAVRDAGYEPELLVPDTLEVTGPDGVSAAIAGSADAPDGFAADVAAALADVSVTVDDRALTPAVNAAIDRLESESTGAVAVVMADLALARPPAIERLVAAGGDVAIAPGRGGGTNALAVRDPRFAVDFHGASYRDHRRIAAERGLTVGVVDSMRLATDVDEPADLAEVLLHNRGVASEWLRAAGFEIETDDGRVSVGRS